MPVEQIALKNIKKIDYIVLPNNTRKTIFQMFQYLKGLGKTPDYLINGTMYSTSTGETITDSKDEFKFINGGNYASQGIAIRNEKELSWMRTYDARNDETVRDFIGSAPTLLIDGQVNLDTKGLSSSFYNTNKIRSFIGYNSEKLFIGCSASAETCTSIANICKGYGMTHALNLDGGGSSSMGKNVNGTLTLINKPTETRAVPNWIAIYLEKEQEKPDMTETKIEVKYNGEVIELEGLLKDSTNYIKLRELSKFGFNVTYNVTEKIPEITKK